MMDSLFAVLATALLIPGIAMAFVPMLPALLYMWIVSFGFALIDGFSTLDARGLVVLGVITVLSIVVDQVSGIVGAKYGGAHGKSLLWGIGGAFAGSLIVPPFGSLLGMFAAVLGAELFYKRSRARALRAAGGAVLGTALGITVNVLLAMAFVGVFLYFVLR